MKNRRVMLSVLFLGAAVFMSSCAPGDETGEETTTPAVQTASAEEFMELRTEQPGSVIDVRTREEFEEGHLADVDGHYNLLSGDFEAALASLDKEETYYLYCRTGNRSGQAAELMIQNGFTKVYNIGGFQDLVDAGVEGSEGL